MSRVPIEVILTAHDEEATIGETIREFLAAADLHGLDVEVLIAEDGSSDRTREVVTGIADHHAAAFASLPRPSGRATAAPLRMHIAWRGATSSCAATVTDSTSPATCPGCSTLFLQGAWSQVRVRRVETRDRDSLRRGHSVVSTAS